jgi:hypothetical protein
MYSDFPKIKIKATGTYTPPPLDIPAILERSKQAPEDVQRDIRRLVKEIQADGSTD